MDMLKVRCLLAFAVFAVLFAFSQTAFADPRLEAFLGKYNALHGRTPLLGHIDSPFQPYHGRLFEEGLDEAKLKTLRRAQKKGDCILVDELVAAGFLGIFPFLKPAFDDRKRYTNLIFMMAKDRRPEHRRCNDHRRLRELFSIRSLAELPPVDFGELDFSKSYNFLDPKEPRSALHGFGISAFCNDYPPSIADLRAIANRPGGMVLTDQEGLYLLERARVHGLGEDNYRQTFAGIKKHFSPDANLSRLRTASRQRKIEEIGFKVEGYWQSQCRFVRQYRLNKLQQ